MLKRWISPLIIAVSISIWAPLSTATTTRSADGKAGEIAYPIMQSQVPASRLARLRHGINLSHWFAQSADYSKAHLESHTTAEDFALIRSLGFDHVRLTIEPAPLFNGDDPGRLKAEHLKYLDNALDLILTQHLAVIVDIHPSDDFKVRLNSNDRHLEAFGKFWRTLALHLSTRDPERVFLEVINEPMVEDGYRWFGMQGKLISAVRAGAPQHTIIASGHRWSGIPELLFLQPYADRNIVYNFHFYEPFAFTHQGASWAGPHLSFYKNIPYPSNPESVSKVLDTIEDDPARFNLLRYGEDGWDARRIEREIGEAAAWAAKYQVPLTCNEFGTFRKFAPPADRVRWIRDMRIAFEKYGIGWTMWDYAGGFAVVNKQNGHATPDVEVVKALGLAVNK
ncbi:MAG TPA: cellulase family glycosylhydrolase [Pyrinomonadaceae bacterium]|nr:cellulase family glycosylhydrolase [Pyrinomonadaceae bacterium]